MFNIKVYRKILEEIRVLGKKTKIVSVSKNHPREAVEDAIKCGVRIFGENRVQEAKTKFDNLTKIYPDIELHLTGPLQTNKVKDAVRLFDVFHTLDREKLAKEFVKSKNTENKKFFIQVNTGMEVNKSGVYIEQIEEFTKYCINDLGLNIVGLMCIPPINDKPHEHFAILANEARKNNLYQLSMGMSSDYHEAIKRDSTYIRVGTALFGKRLWWKPS